MAKTTIITGDLRPHIHGGLQCAPILHSDFVYYLSYVSPMIQMLPTGFASYFDELFECRARGDPH